LIHDVPSLVTVFLLAILWCHGKPRNNLLFLDLPQKPSIGPLPLPLASFNDSLSFLMI